MAIKLAEQAIDSVIAILQSDYQTELTAIQTDRGDGITLTAPDNDQYYNRPKMEIGGGTTHCEVFEDSYEQTTPWIVDSDRATWEINVNVRVTSLNREVDADPGDTMATRSRRMAAGVVIVVAKNPHLGESSSLIQHAWVLGVDPPWATEENSVVVKMQTNVRLLVKAEETA